MKGLETRCKRRLAALVLTGAASILVAWRRFQRWSDERWGRGVPHKSATAVTGEVQPRLPKPRENLEVKEAMPDSSSYAEAWSALRHRIVIDPFTYCLSSTATDVLKLSSD
jgi:hypothetical protein